MKKFLIIIFLVSNFVANSFSQNNKISQNIVWQTKNIEGKDILLFPNANLNADLIPYFSGYFYVKNYNYKVIIKDIRTGERVDIPHINIYVSEKVEINQKVYKAKDKYILHYSFYPFVKKNGNYYMIKSFTAEIIPQKNNKLPDYTPKYAGQSVLNSGKWVKIAIPQSGVYKIPYSKLEDLGFSNPANVRVFGNDAGMLPEYNDQATADDLIENTVYYGSDYILFYAEGASLWKYDETNDFFYLNKNCYTDTAYYFLTDKNTGFDNKISVSSASGSPSVTITKSLRLEHHELHEVNLLHSGRPFLGEAFDYTTTQSFSFEVNSPDASSPSKAKVTMAARSPYNSTANLSLSGTNATLSFSSAYGEEYQKYADYKSIIFDFNNSSASPTLQITYNKPTSSAKAWLDYITLNISENLTFYEQMHIRSTQNIGNGKVSKFSISNASSEVIVWDVTEPTHPYKMQTSLYGSTLSFVVNTDTLRHFIAFTVGNCPEPVYDGSETGEVANQNLHGISASTDMLVITAPEFLQSAESFADIHHSHDNLNVSVATTTQIYNEFSSGMKDVSAIRNFIRMVYLKSAGRLAYVLLLGDGTYDNFSSVSEFNPDYIPTYQTLDYFNTTTHTTVFDNYYALLDDNEGGINGDLDVAIGRLPVKTPDEAQILLTKLQEYYSSSNFGEWQNIITLFTDDRDDGWETFTLDAESVADIVDSLYPFFNIKKIYLDSYLQKTSANGEEYPDAVTELNNRINNGTLIVNYLGHGGHNALTSERVVTIHQIENWHNQGKYPLFITGTCEFSRFDDAEPAADATSAGELTLLNPSGGTFALITTARVSYASNNTFISQKLYNYLFAEQDGKKLTIGDAYMQALNIMTSQYKTFFFLLGDPAVRLAYPTQQANITKINGIDINSFSDTLHALDKVTLSGEIRDNSGNLLQNFNGEAVLTFFDKKRILQTLDNDGYGAMTYWNQFNMLFKGKASVRNGIFSFNFIIPKDIFYNYGTAKFSLFAMDNSETATGIYDPVLGGINSDATEDKNGPQIRLFINDTNFVSGSITDQNPEILALLSDESGINISSAGIGHDISAILDNSPDNTYSLNEYFEGELDNSTRGTVRYGLYNLNAGQHTVKLKAWDIYNNSSEKSIDFVVVENNKIMIEHLLNYPNPFTTHTSFYFDHNQPGVPLEILLQIFTVSGKLVKTFHLTMTTIGYHSDPIEWDGLDDFGKPIGRGVYVYRLKILTPTGQTTEKYEKLLILK